MPRRKKECDTEGCVNITHGRLCRPCDLERRKSSLSKADYQRQWHLKTKYGLDLMGFDAMWQAFRGRCGICGCEMEMPSQQRGQALNVVALDHDHNTGRIRGLLCNACNKGLGMFKDDINLLKAAIKWLEMSK